MGILGNACKEAWETAKGTFREATYDAPIIGPFCQIVNGVSAWAEEWEEVKTPRSFLGKSRGREIGMIKANRKDIKVMGISDDGFYVKKGQKTEAVNYLNSVNLKAE